MTVAERACRAAERACRAGRTQAHHAIVGRARLGRLPHASVDQAVPMLCRQAVSRAAAGNRPIGL
jgi:hypothetical protein